MNPGPDVGSSVPLIGDEVPSLDVNNATDNGDVLVDTPLPECRPKDFSRSDPKLGGRQRTTKGTLQFMSPCGAKVYTSEMKSSESLSALFYALSRFMPIIKPRLDDICKQKLENGQRYFLNPRTGKTGMAILFNFVPILWFVIYMSYLCRTISSTSLGREIL